MDIDIDKPSILAALVIGLAASLLIDVAGGSRYVEAQEAPTPRSSAVASGPTTRAGCPTTTASGRPLPSTPASRVPTPGPTDLQVNSSGIGAGGGGAAGTIGTQPADPCEPLKHLGQRARDAASAAEAQGTAKRP